MNAAIDLAGKLATFNEAWQPRTVSMFNGHDVMVAKLRGEYTGMCTTIRTIFSWCWPAVSRSTLTTARP